MNHYALPVNGTRLFVPAEHLRGEVRAAPDPWQHDSFLVDMTPGAAEALAEAESARVAARDAARAVAAVGREHVAELQHPHTAAGRLDEIRAMQAEAQAASDAAKRAAERALVNAWRILYVVDGDTIAARRRAYARRANEQHARAVEALATLRDALEARERSYAAVGHPGDREHWTNRGSVHPHLPPSSAFSEVFRTLDPLVADFPSAVAEQVNV